MELFSLLGRNNVISTVLHICFLLSIHLSIRPPAYKINLEIRTRHVDVVTAQLHE